MGGGADYYNDTTTMGSGHGGMPLSILSLSKSRLTIKTLVLSLFTSQLGLKEADYTMLHLN